jgi:hypothetical protein
MKRILFVFLDGVGLGPPAATNPLATATWSAFERMASGQSWTRPFASVDADRHVVRPIDATLGLEGLPQSGTGQATLFSGANGAALVGRHFGPFPHSATHDVLDRNNLFHRVHALFTDRPQPAAFANAYPPQFFDRMQQNGRWTVTTRCCHTAGVEVRGLADVQHGRALTAELTGAAWRNQLDLDVPILTEAEAGTRLADIHRQHAFTLFEYFLTDKVGHGRLDLPPAHILRGLDRFFGAILEALDPERESLVVTSDHGNLEDTERRTHTRNPVPLVVQGWAAPYFRDVASIADVTPSIVAALRDTAHDR